MKDKLNAIIELASDTQDSVSMIHNDSLNIYRDIYAINVPDINAANLKQNISALNMMVGSIINSILFYNRIYS